MKRTVRVTLSFFAVLIGLGMVAAPAAHAIQASGSIILSPAKQLQLAKGETVNVDVSVVNTSSQTPLPPGPAAPATLTGPITVELGCTDCGCAQQLAGSLLFVPGPAAGCVTKTGSVVSCVAGGNPNEVVINLAAAGVALPNNSTPTAIATIAIKMNVDSGPPLGIRAGTEVCGLTACITPPDQACVSCSAEGCTFVTPNAAASPPCDCPHLCPSKIVFIGDAAKPDSFELHSIILPGNGFDPANKPFTVSMSNSGGQIFSFTLPAGSLVDGGDAFTYTNNTAKTTGGISLVKLAARDDTPGAFRLDIQGFSANLQPDTTIPADNPNITTSWDVGGQSWTSGIEAWDRKSFGWQLNQFGFCQPAVHG
jgi:hypothetical protein